MSDLGHVHGLAADAQTGVTYVATHTGVWQLDSSYLTGDASTASPSRIGDGTQDTMGFSIAGKHLLFASGHPDPANNPDQDPSDLGLIESRDEATTWKSVSLSGQTDFHDLVTTRIGSRDGRVRIYGYDAGRQTVMVSDSSGMDWQTPGATIALRKLAVNAHEPDTVYATTESGLRVSRDAGKSFTGIPGAPNLFLIDAIDSAPNSLVGVDVNGVIWTTRDAGTTWRKRGGFQSPPEALAQVTGAKLPWLLGTDSRGIVATPDYGRTWKVLLKEQR